MYSPLYRLLVLVVIASLPVWIECKKDDNPVVSDFNVHNTNFVAKEAFSLGVAIGDQTQIVVEAINGTITINGVAETDSMRITGQRSVGSESMEDAEENLQNLLVNVQDLTSEFFIGTVQPLETGGRNFVVDYNITLPENFKLFVLQINGVIDIESIDNAITVSTVNGEIELDHIVGNVSAQIINGNIIGNIKLPLNESIDLRTTNGAISLSIPQTTSAAHDCQCDDRNHIGNESCGPESDRFTNIIERDDR